MEFAFTPELEQLARDGRLLGEYEVAPSAADRDASGRWDCDLFAGLAGLAGAFLPREHGGLGLSALETSVLLEGFGVGSGDAGLSLALGVHGLLCGVPIWKFGTAEQQQRYLRRTARGESVGGLSLLELEGAAGETPVVTATRLGGGWILDGVKTHVVNGPVADHFLITATTDSSRRSAFLVDRDTRGLTVCRSRVSGPRTCSFGELRLDRCMIPGRALLGTEGMAHVELVPLLVTLDRTLLISPWVGIMRLLTEHATQRVRDGVWFSRPMARFQSFRATVADMRTRCELSAGLVYRAAWQLDHFSRPPRQDAAAAKLFVSTCAQVVANDAARLCGMDGFDDHGLVKRACRDALFLTVAGGRTELLRSVIAGALLELG